MRTTILLIAFLGACTASGPEVLDGFHPREAGPGQVQILGPIVHIDAGADVTLCSYLPADQAFAETMDITAAWGEQSQIGSHHSVLYMVQREKPVDTHECTDDDMINSRYLAGAGGGDAGGSQDYIPDGVAYRVEAGQQLMVQTHWINTTSEPIDGQAAYVLSVQPPSEGVELAQLFTWTSTQIDVPANSTGHAHTVCTVQADMAFYRLGGHAHEHGTHVTMQWIPAGSPPDVFYDEAWQPYYTFDPPRLDFSRDEAMQVHAGDSLSIDCDYTNDTSDDIQFPREMCTGFGFFFPGTSQFDCTDGNWPTGQ
jgi:hypothetical protein